MSPDDNCRRTVQSEPPPRARRQGGQEPPLRIAGDLRRLVIPPTMVTLLLIGGVYWIRTQLPAASGGKEQSSLIQVHLLPRPGPAQIPVLVSPQPMLANVPTHAELPAEEPESNASHESVAAPQSDIPSAVEPSAPSIKPAPPSAKSTSSAVAAKFRHALLRHIAKYQHYPNAARPGRLQGAVETLFSINRSGTLLDLKVKTSSGQEVLDQAALETIRHAQPLPPIPSELPDHLTIQVWLAFDPS